MYFDQLKCILNFWNILWSCMKYIMILYEIYYRGMILREIYYPGMNLYGTCCEFALDVSWISHKIYFWTNPYRSQAQWIFTKYIFYLKYIPTLLIKMFLIKIEMMEKCLFFDISFLHFTQIHNTFHKYSCPGNTFHKYS